MKIFEINGDLISNCPNIEGLALDNSILCGSRDSGTVCFVIVNTPNIVNSNSAIIKSDNQIIIIDPGASKKQAEYLLKMLRFFNIRQPVYLLFTHCHIDHTYNLFTLKKNTEFNFITVMHPFTAAIYGGDKNRELLLEAFVEMEAPRYSPDILLPVKGKINETEFFNKTGLHLKMKTCPAFTDAEVNIYQLQINDIKVECVYTPGHSPDCVSYRIDDTLFSGDILFAFNTGIAGITGWSLDDLKLTVSVICNCLKFDKCINNIVSGHGNVLNKINALKIVGKTDAALSKIKNIKAIDNNRKKHLIKLADILLNKSREMFTVIAGRLHRIEYYLDELDEKEEAEKIRSLTDFNIIDEYIADFMEFAGNYRVSGLPEMVCYLKGVEFVGRLKKIFNAELLKQIIDEHYLNICLNLINSYFNIVNGINFSSPPPFDCAFVIKKLIDYIEQQNQNLKIIPFNVEDEDAFTEELVRRFSYKPLIEYTPEISFINELENDAAIVSADMETFENIIYSALEFFAIRRVKSVMIRLFAENSKILISLTTSPEIIIPSETIKFYNMLFCECGAEILYIDNFLILKF